MVKLNEKLKKISDSIFQEAEPPEGRSSPLEWKRRFNFVSLPLKNIQIINNCTVHDIEFGLNEEKSNPHALINPKIATQTAITGILDEDRVRDGIYFAVENEDEEGIYSIERGGGETKITLKSGEPIETEEKDTPSGLYWGLAFRMNDTPGEDGLDFDLSIPQDQMNFLISALRADENSAVEIGAYLLSFTFEVEDFFREHYHRRDFVINEMTDCFVSRVQITSNVGQQYIKPNVETEEERDTDLYQEVLTPEQQSHQELLKTLLSYSKPLNRLVTAVWVLIIIIALHAFFF